MGKKIWQVALIIIGVGVIIRGIYMIIGDPVEKDLLDYVNNHLKSAEKLSIRATDAYNATTGSNYKDDATMSDSLKQITIPTYSQFADSLHSLKPSTVDVQGLNAKYISATDTQLAGFKMMLIALEKEDSTIVVEANRMIQKGDKGIIDFDNALDSVSKKHDVEITKKKPK